MPFNQPASGDILFLTVDAKTEFLPGANESRWVWWRPSLRSILAPSLPLCTAMIWWVFHHLGIFRTKEFAVLYLCVDGLVVHRSVVFPRYFRFPFMADHDLQIGDTWTHPQHRGRHLGRRALDLIVTRYGGGRRLWYLTEAGNAPSVKAAEAVGFRIMGKGVRRKRWGLSFLGYFELYHS